MFDFTVVFIVLFVWLKFFVEFGVRKFSVSTVELDFNVYYEFYGVFVRESDRVCLSIVIEVICVFCLVVRFLICLLVL